MCVRYLIEMWEKDSISLWILEFRFCRSWRSLIVVACTLPLIHVVVKKGGSTIHPSWDRNVWRMACLSNFRLVIAAGNLSLQ